MQDFNSIINLDDSPLVIKWRLTNCCNYKCSYCVRKKKWDEISKLKEDKEIIKNTIPQIIRIINEKQVITKIDLIGGEVSLFDLKELINEIKEGTNDLLKKVTITTNFSRSIEYYNDLIKYCNDNKIRISITASFHPEFTNLNNMINKAKDLIKSNYLTFKLEMVSTNDNLDLVNDFINQCNKNGLIYFVDGDVNSTDFSNIIIQANENKPNRYKIDYDDHIEYIKTVRELGLKYGNYRLINLNGYYCTLDYDYVYIEQNKHVGTLKDGFKCKMKEPIENFHFKTEPIICQNDGCSLCGAMSVFKERKYYEK